MNEVDAGELWAEFAARQYWEGVRLSVRAGDAPDLIRLTRPGVVAELTDALTAVHGQVLRDVIRSDLAVDARNLDFITRLRELAAGDPEDGQTLAAQARLDLIPASEFREADVAAEILATVAAAFEQADMFALTAHVDLADEGVGQPKPPAFRVTHRMMSDPGQRQQLGVHGAVRGKLPRADGSGKHYPTPEPPEAADGQLGDTGRQPGSQTVPPRPGRRDSQIKRRNKKRQVRKRRS